MANKKVDNFAKLTDVLGYNPSSFSKPTTTILEKVRKEMVEKREAEAEERLKQAFVKAIEIAQQKTKLEREFNGAVEKMNKELGKILPQLSVSGSASGEGQAEETAETEEKSEETKSE